MNVLSMAIFRQDCPDLNVHSATRPTWPEPVRRGAANLSCGALTCVAGGVQGWSGAGLPVTRNAAGQAVG